MNAKDVYREVSAMVSQGAVESEAAIRASLNRALAEIGHLYPRKQFLTLRQVGEAAVFRLSAPREVKKESPLTVTAFQCKEIVLTGTGKGEVVLMWDGKQIHREALEGLPFSFCKTLSSLGAVGQAELMLLFRSESGMILEELVLYDRAVTSHRVTQGNYTLYHMAEEMPSFVSFSGECYKNGVLLDSESKEVLLEQGCVSIDCHATGVYEIGCYAAPTAVTEENEGKTLDISAEILYLVPLLTAYYVRLEAEDARADDFLARYREAWREFRNTAAFAVNDRVEDVRGW